MKNPRQKSFNFIQRRRIDHLCASFVNWLLDNHPEVIKPLLEQWKYENEVNSDE